MGIKELMYVCALQDLVFILLTAEPMIWVDKYTGKLTAQINSGTGESSYSNWTDGGVVAVVREVWFMSSPRE